MERDNLSTTAQVVKTTFKLKRSTADRWEEINPTLALGEPGFVYDTNQLKIGDGLTPWNSLPYIAEGGGVGGGILVVDTFADLPEVGEENILYKVAATQLIYIWNAITSTYQELGQGGGGAEDEDGYIITLQNAMDSRIFAVLQGDPVYLSFRYASVDKDGLNDGPGIGTIIVNDVKKTTIAIQQKLNTIEITKYLALGDNSVKVIVENSDGKQEYLTYQIQVINLQLSTDFKEMDIYTTPKSEKDNYSISFSFVITGAGTKTLHYLMDGEEIDTEELTNTDKMAHVYKIEMNKYEPGDHIFKAYADMEVNNMKVTSNTLTLGIMYVVEDFMVNSYILSTFNEKETTQGEIVNIPYLVYNQQSEKINIYQRIYNEDGSLYSEKPLSVDQTVQSWITQDYPAGKIVFEIEAESDTQINAFKRFEMKVEESTFNLTPITAGLELEFSAQGRSNNELNPGQWSYGDIAATFERFAWSIADGWVESDEGETVLRFLPKNKMIIPYQPFATDKRSSGYTIEIDMATHNVKDYDSVVISCVDKGRGLTVKSQSMTFKSEQSKEITTVFKEDERVHLTLTIEPQTINRFIKLYINGVLCGVEQYVEGDNFQQETPQYISIGSDTCGLDLYKIRLYNRALDDTEQLNNYICDRSTLAEKLEAQARNQIYDISGNLTIASLPKSIPYLVMQCEELPQYKGDKKKEKSIYFVDRLNPKRSFSADGCQFDVQGTSSAGYPIKNFKVKFNEGIKYNDGTTADGYPILEGELISKCLCLKADYASSEQANNVMLVDYYDQLVRRYFETPAQQEDSRVRTAIAGRPIVVFWENTQTGEIKFQGQYNMNNDKSNENVFGFDREKWPHTECWEFSNNTSDRTLFKKSEWTETVYDKESDSYKPAWMSDFEARFPDLDNPYSDYTQFKRFCDFIVSTDRRQATNAALDSAITYDSVTYTTDSAEYRLAKFKNEFSKYGFIDPFIFYYIFTETFLMIDSRAKNMFLTTYDGEHWFPIPYDFDTAIGINNEGALVFDYDLEDTDVVGDELVFNGQESTLWINIRDAFQAKIFAMYDELRQSDKFTYDVIAEKMDNHQSVWPEAIWNENAKVKYLDIYLTEGEKYFEMCQGNKAAQRRWWLFNAFKYRDSKYQCGDSEEFTAFFRAYAPSDMTVVPYQNLWPRVDYTDTYPVSKRAKRNEEVLLECPLDTASDTEIFLRSADRMASFGDLSQYKADTVKFASAVKLQDVILGSSAAGYENHKLTSVELGNNRLVSYLNVENCTALKDPINLSQCYNLETVKAKGSKLSSINFPVGGHLTTLELPETFANLTIRNQHNITSFSMNNYNSINTLWIDDTPGLPIESILLNTPLLDRVRLVNTTWSVSNENNLRTIFEKLKKCSGLDANGNTTDMAVVTGYVEIDSISEELLEELNEYFKELIVVVDGKAQFFIRYLNRDNTLLYKYVAAIGENAIDPVSSGIIEQPIFESLNGDTKYTYDGWSDLPTNIQGPHNIIAEYKVEYKVWFLNGDNQTIMYEEYVLEGNPAQDPLSQGLIPVPTKTSSVEFDFVYKSWNNDLQEIFEPTEVKPLFNEFKRKYQVLYYNDNVQLAEISVYYGTIATYPYPGEESEIKKIIGGIESDYYEFAGWRPEAASQNNTIIRDEEGNVIITGKTYFYAVFDFNGWLTQSWKQIAEDVASNNLATYGLGGKKLSSLTYNYEGVEYNNEIEFEIIGLKHDTKIDGSKAELTFRALIPTPTVFMNNGVKDWNGQGTLDGGGWAISDLREWLNGNSFFGMLDKDLQNAIKTVIKQSDNGYYDYHNSAGQNIVPTLTTSEDKIFIASATELNSNTAGDYTMLGQGDGYSIFTNNESRKIPGYFYWTRSTAGKSTLHSFCCINSDGDLSISGAGNKSTLVICFCI